MPSSPTILIAMPLFEGWEHVGETLESIKNQTYRNFRVLISVDGGDRRSYEACQPHLNDPRFEIVL
jgi:glycosyltransferase involved in cell wall biosynthesis